jgi:AcrR family transcriptional regulator
MSRKTIERDSRKKSILNAARRVFDEKGIENTSMDDIAVAAEYTRRTLYAYFRSRDEICLSILVEDHQARWKEQKTQLARAETGLEKIVKWAESLYSFTRRNRSSIRLQLYWDFKGIDRTLIGDEVFASFERINDELAQGLREIFQLGLDDGSLRPDLKTDLSISQFLCSFRAVLNRALSSTYSFTYFDPDEYVKHYLEIFARGIRNEGVSHGETK